MGIRAMARDESVLEYAFRVILNLLANFTIGTIGAVIAFVWSLYGVIVTYQSSMLAGIVFFLCASLSAVAFAATWLFGLYGAAAGTVYVGAKFAASNLRLQGDPAGGPNRRGRVRYD